MYILILIAVIYVHTRHQKIKSDGVHVQVVLDDGCNGVLLHYDGDKASLDDGVLFDNGSDCLPLDDGRNASPLDGGGNVVHIDIFDDRDHSARMTDNLPIDYGNQSS